MLKFHNAYQEAKLKASFEGKKKMYQLATINSAKSFAIRYI